MGCSGAPRNHIGAVHMQVTTIGIDLAKNVFQVHGVDANDKVGTAFSRGVSLPLLTRRRPRPGPSTALQHYLSTGCEIM